MRSMTGFGAGEAEGPQWRVTAELSGVNRKQLDISVNLPQTVSSIDPEIRKIITDRISRGRVNARITLVSLTEAANELIVDKTLVRQYIEAAKSIAAENDLQTEISAADLLRCPGLFKIEETKVEIEEVEGLITAAVKMALDNLAAMQIREGLHLKEDLETRVSEIEKEIATIQGYAKDVVAKYRESLFSRLSDCGLEIDLNDERVLREIALYAEKSDITEEITRIGSHITQFRTYFATGEDDPVGRPLDFLCQELNRELNTIGSKANHAEIAQSIVNSKTELEKIREQVQNVQ